MRANTIVRSMSGEGTGSTTFELSIGDWPPNVMIRWDWIAAINEDSRGTYTDLYLRRGSERYLLKRGRQDQGNRTVEVSPGVKAPGDFQVCAEFAGAGDGDKLELYAFGEIVE